ncbi:RHS repeat-associated core domain-containing protein [Stenotrophomonas sp. PFBMAA-4]|uniref:RHS repeat-associated core domain-containing protein n=1 Tax=Stenotrophomonas sp. PFBMAA-4 TaxID=3043301 RepID=UPI0024B4E0AF|nr:RHS repeat-associated core domain-containing protein [Stenotrophomonas sp. PFBMAA-4]MDI9273144.1 RHS repeat-associated core domain-containing protein [Stenotrophomonas sp. PFBMAA-4]
MDPQLGVFLSVDPVTAYEQSVGQFNRYRYASSNPYRFVDPDGRRDKIKAQAAKSVDIMCAASAQGGLPCAD